MSYSSRSALAAACTIICLAVFLPGCSRDDRQVRQEAMKRGDEYVARDRPREAIIEYRKAIQRGGKEDPELHRKLARAYMQAGDVSQAYESFRRAADLDPKDLDSPLQAARILVAAGEYDAAKTAAERILARDPKNLQGTILLGHALAGLDLPKDALRKMEEAIELAPSDARAYAALGSVQLSLGSKKDAAAAFEKAVKMAPDSRDAHLALASYYFAVQRPDDAGREFARAREIAPDDELTNRAIAAFYINTGRIAEAERYLQTAARAHDRARLALSDYYLLTKRFADAERALEGLEKRPDFAESVGLRRAAIRFAEGKRDEAEQIVDGMLEGKKRSARAYLLKARFARADQRTADAIPLLRKAVAIEPTLIAAQYELGTALLERRDVDGARAAFTEVTKLNPHSTAAQLQLSRIALAAGDTGRAVQAAREAASGNPDDAGAQIALVRTLRAAGERERADAELDRLMDRHPDAASLWVERGSIRLESGDANGARQAFEKAAALAPSAIEPVAGLVTMYARTRRLPEARKLVEGRLAAHPDDARLLTLAGRVAAMGRDFDTAEQYLRRAIEKDSTQADAYGMLGQLYLTTNRLADARREYERLARTHPAVAHTMLGLIAAAERRTADAASEYERALAADPAAAVAANNLAWMRLEEGKTEDAVRLARVAQQQLPSRPEMNDTLGWVLHKAKRHDAAVQYLARAVEQNPESALYHFHLGMAAIDAGQPARGEASLKRALAIDPAFPSRDQAKAALQRTAAVAAK
jgi:tetratricopeptide (TPR) repeat protein